MKRKALPGVARAKQLTMTLREFRATSTKIGGGRVCITDVAEAAGIATSTLSRAERGEWTLRPETAVAIAAYFGVPGAVIEECGKNSLRASRDGAI